MFDCFTHLYSYKNTVFSWIFIHSVQKNAVFRSVVGLKKNGTWHPKILRVVLCPWLLGALEPFDDLFQADTS